METRTRTANDKRWPIWLATLLLAFAAVLAQLAPPADAHSPACASLVSMTVDAQDPVAADVDPEVLPATLPERAAPGQLRPALAIGGSTQHLEPPPQRPPRTLA